MRLSCVTLRIEQRLTRTRSARAVMAAKDVEPVVGSFHEHEGLRGQRLAWSGGLDHLARYFIELGLMETLRDECGQRCESHPFRSHGLALHGAARACSYAVNMNVKVAHAAIQGRIDSEPD